MAAYTSVHYAHKISARAGTTTGAPLIIEIDRENGGLLPDEVTLFTDDHELSRMLADAITRAVAERNAVLSKQKDSRVMAQEQHTPGPWSVIPAVVKGKVLFHNIDPAGNGKWRGSVASVHSAEGIEGISTEERDANARLIAAAPELLAQSATLLASLYPDALNPEQFNAWCMLTHTVAKAEGRS